jgi:protein O-GlcNAc transferase
MTKLVTFSLWGDDPKYCIGAVRNAELALKHYPGWRCRFYFTPLDENDEFLPNDGVLNQTIGELRKMPNVDLVAVNHPSSWIGMFWRFLPASEDDVDVFITRDCDSRITAREASAVHEWLQGPKLIHVMRDHPEHSAPIMGGMWGAKNGALPDLKDQIEKYTQGDFWQVDQNFLREIVWPSNYHKVLAHDDWNRFPQAETKPFPTPRETDNFVGSIIGPNEERLHPEHHANFSSR